MASDLAKLREHALERRATDSENRLKLMARHAPIGFVQISNDGNIEWANDQFYDITGHDRTKPEMAEFYNCFLPEERDVVAKSLEALQYQGATREVHELRLSRTWQPPGLHEQHEAESSAWILALGDSYLSLIPWSSADLHDRPSTPVRSW